MEYRGLIEDAVGDIELLNKDMVEYDKINTDRIRESVLRYLGVCDNLARTDPDLIKRARAALSRTISLYAMHKSPVYQGKLTQEVIDGDLSSAFTVAKADLADKEKWFTDDFKSSDNKTSGTTGPPFQYKLWDEVFIPIEQGHHYQMILDEFGIAPKPNVLHMVTGFKAYSYKDIKSGRASIHLANKDQIPNYVMRIHAGHGDVDSEMWHIDFDEKAYIAVKDFCKYIINFIQEKDIDVLLASGGVFELLSTYLIADEATSFPPLTKLMSNTGDWVNTDTLEFLAEAGVTQNWCNHMRCWDGGASFFTCKFGTYHLQDELADLKSDKDNRMISTDFFSYPSPFVNYWNGDYCKIGEEYEQCKCGRWHRSFELISRRSRSSRTTEGAYYDAQHVYDMLIKKYDVGFISFQDNTISVEDSKLSEEVKSNIVADMMKEHVAVNFFTQPSLRRFGIKFGKEIQPSTSEVTSTTTTNTLMLDMKAKIRKPEEKK